MKKQTVSIELPDEFVERCKAQEVEPEIALRGFIADLCYLDCNDGDGMFNTNGSDERLLANEYFDRAHFASDV